MMLVLSIFPGIDLLGRAFEEEGFCVVRGPDLLWGGDIQSFHPPAGVFEGVIGGPPCQAFSVLRHLIEHQGFKPKFGNLIPEFERVVADASPSWFLMENVLDAPIPEVEGFKVWSAIVRDKWVGGVQPRPRRFSFGTSEGTPLDILWVALMKPETEATLVAGHGLTPGQRQSVLADGRRGIAKIGGTGKLKPWARTETDNVRPIEDACEAMGLPRDFTEYMPFTMHGKRSIIGNAVPMPMGRAIAQAVKAAIK